MAAPAHTVRQTPVGRYLRDGYQSLLAFALDPDLSVWEKTVGFPGIDGGEAVDNTTMHSVTWRTNRPRYLKTLTGFNVVCAFDPIAYTQCLALINREGAITSWFSDDSKYSFFGYLKSVSVAEAADGTQPEMTLEIVPTCWDAVNNVEADPVLVETPGT